jgi:adenylate kinase
MPRVVRLGMPGVGKGTYAKLLQKHLAVPHISTGSMFRDEVSRATDIGKQAAGYLRSGEIVPDSLLAKILKSRLNAGDTHQGFLLDGVPRRDTQIAMVDEAIFPAKLDLCLLLTLNEKLLLQKITARRECKQCGHSYNLAHIEEPPEVYMPAILPKVEGVCDSCGSSPVEFVQREDDKMETVFKRLQIHKELSTPVEEIYRERGLLQEFELTSGVADMWPKLSSFVDKFVQ